MIKLMNYTCAFLQNGENYLLMKRAKNRDVHPDFWSGVGGKIEASEINDPYSACIREISEETHMNAENISDLVLRYIVIRKHKDVIRLSYIYFGMTNTTQFVNSDEGDLYWVPKEELCKKQFTSTFSKMIEHYLSDQSDRSNIFVGTAENNNGKLNMSWSKVEDFTD